MDIYDALRAFTALAHETRLWALRLLVQAGAEGLSAGEVAECLGARQNTMSAHLKQLRAAGLIRRRRRGRQVLYEADYGTVGALVVFLTADWCENDAGLREPLAAQLGLAMEDYAGPGYRLNA